MTLLPALALAGARAELPPDLTLAAFEHALAAQPSATRALAEWCELRHISPQAPADISAQLVPGPAMPLPRGARRLLGIGADEPLGFRHVRLSCGATVLSEAYNWYVPARLTAAMNQALESTRTPFGKVAAPLNFTRTALASHRGPAPGCPPETILANRGLLRLPDGRGLALVLECYTRANLTAAPGPAPIAPPPPAP